MSKRNIAFFLLCLILFFSGCQEKKATPSQQISLMETIESDEIDFFGYSCTIGQEYPETEPFRYKPDTVYSDLVFQRMKDINRQYNCSSSVHTFDSGNYLQGTIATVAAGGYIAEIAATHQPSYLVYAGALYPLEELKDILDYENSTKYGSKGLLEIGMMNSCPYTVCPVLWPEKLSSYSYSIIAVNENLIRDNNLTDPRELHEQKQWTFSVFLSKLPEYTIDQGDGNQFKAFLSGWNVLQYATSANGFSYSISEENLNSDILKTPVFFHAADFYRTLATEYKDCVNLSPGSYENTVKLYISNQFVLYNTSFAHLVQSVVYEADNYGIVPFPCGPDVEYGKAPTLISDFDSIGIFSCADSPEDAALYISLLLEPFEGYGTEEERKATLQNIFFDDRDIDIYLTHLDNVEFNYWTSGTSSVWDSMKKLGQENSGAEIAEKYGEALSEALQNQAYANAPYMNEH